MTEREERERANADGPDTETAHGAREVDECRHLARGAGQIVERVRSDGDRRNHDADNVHAPADDDSADREVVLERLADNDQPRDHERSGEVVDREAALGPEQAGVTADVACRDEVVGPVPKDLADDEGDERREVEEGDCLEREGVASGRLGKTEND